MIGQELEGRLRSEARAELAAAQQDRESVELELQAARSQQEGTVQQLQQSERLLADRLKELRALKDQLEEEESNKRKAIKRRATGQPVKSCTPVP